MTIVLEIPEPTPSLNRLMRSHWSKAYKIRSHWHWLVRAALLEAGYRRTEPQSTRIRVTVTRFGRCILDQDNFVAGCKFLVDGLVKAKVLEDDTPAHLEAIYFQHAQQPYRTVVCIQPVAALPAAA